MQVLALDTYNGTPGQAESYRQITGLTAPMLREPINGTDYAGARLEDILVVDRDGYVRMYINASSEDQYARLNAMVDALLNKDPVIALSLRQVYFGRTINVGESKTVKLDIDNTGAGAIEITGYAAPEGVAISPASFTVNPFEKQTIEIVFSPTKTGTFSGSITLQHADNAVQTLQLPILDITVEGQVLPSITLAQQRIDFGQTELDKAVEKTLTISNGGPGALNVSGIETTLDGIGFSETRFSIPASGSKDITITFNPKVEGALSGDIRILSDDPTNGALTISLSGSAIFIPADPRADFDGSGKIDFPDFLSFVRVFGTEDATHDLDGSGRVDFGDFLIFSKSFGKATSG